MSPTPDPDILNTDTKVVFEVVVYMVDTQPAVLIEHHTSYKMIICH
jgi:hypothetical protein